MNGPVGGSSRLRSGGGGAGGRLRSVVLGTAGSRSCGGGAAGRARRFARRLAGIVLHVLEVMGRANLFWMPWFGSDPPDWPVPDRSAPGAPLPPATPSAPGRSSAPPDHVFTPEQLALLARLDADLEA